MFIQTRYPKYQEVDLGKSVFVKDDVAVWDKLFHLPVVANTFITNYTGLVLSKEYKAAGLSGKAYYRRVYYAMLTSSIINYQIPKDHDKMMNEYLLSHDEEKQLGFAYITAIIADADDMNNYADVAVEHGLQIGVTQDEILKALNIPMVKMLIDKYQLALVNITNTISKENYRSDY